MTCSSWMSSSATAENKVIKLRGLALNTGVDISIKKHIEQNSQT